MKKIFFFAAVVVAVLSACADNPVGTQSVGGSFGFSIPVAPVANFDVDSTSGIVPLTVKFTDMSTDDGTIVARAWDFADGNTSTSTNPTHTFTASGVYNVELEVIDDKGLSDVISKTVVVVEPGEDPEPVNYAPVANFDVDSTSGIVPLTVKFTDMSTDDGTIVARAWDFADGNTSTSTNPTHTFTASGVYNVELEVIDDKGLSDVISKTVVVVEPKPTTGKLRIISNPPGGNADMGSLGSKVTPATWDSLAPGTYRGTITLTGYLPANVEVEIVAGQTTNIILNLVPDLPPDPSRPKVIWSGDVYVHPNHTPVSIGVLDELAGADSVFVTFGYSGDRQVEEDAEVELRGTVTGTSLWSGVIRDPGQNISEKTFKVFESLPNEPFEFILHSRAPSYPNSVHLLYITRYRK